MVALAWLGGGAGEDDRGTNALYQASSYILSGPDLIGEKV